MKRLIWATTIFVLAVVLLLPGVMVSLVSLIPAYDQPGYGIYGSVKIYGDHSFRQTFISKNENLAAIGTTIKNPMLENKQDVIFNLYSGGNLIRTSTISGLNIEDGEFVKFIFDPISDSKGKEYLFTISSPSAGEKEILELFLVPPTEEILSYVYDEEVFSGGTPMVTFHKPNSKWEVIKSVYSNLFSRFLH